jgi:integrase
VPVAANRELAEPLKERNGRLRFLGPDEERRLLEAAREPFRTVILSGIYTGLRKGEVLTLQKPDVDLRRNQLTVQAAYAKSGRRRTIPSTGRSRGPPS